jgi:aryl-alcohol dehydrogenase-like predicted oxidoreductase
MTQRSLGSSDLSVFPLCLGGNVFGWTASTAESEAVLDAYVAGGGNFVDTADAYSAWVDGNVGGESETIIGNWMTSRGNRADVIVATKVAKLRTRPGLHPENIRVAADESLARLATDYIDLYYAHEDDDAVPLEEIVQAFDGLIRAGKVRAVGLSNFTPERVSAYVDVATANGWALPVAVQPHYNLVFRAEFETTMAQVCADHNIGVAPYFALGSGLLTGKYASAADLAGAARSGGAGMYASDQAWGVVALLREIAEAHDVSPATIALAWLRDRPAVTAPIASARVADQVPALLRAAEFVLPDSDAQRLTERSAGL